MVALILAPLSLRCWRSIIPVRRSLSTKRRKTTDCPVLPNRLAMCAGSSREWPLERKLNAALMNPLLSRLLSAALLSVASTPLFAQKGVDLESELPPDARHLKIGG